VGATNRVNFEGTSLDRYRIVNDVKTIRITKSNAFRKGPDLRSPIFFSVKPRPQLNAYARMLHSHCNRIMTQRLKVTNELASKNCYHIGAIFCGGHLRYTVGCV